MVANKAIWKIGAWLKNADSMGKCIIAKGRFFNAPVLFAPAPALAMLGTLIGDKRPLETQIRERSRHQGRDSCKRALNRNAERGHGGEADDSDQRHHQPVLNH